MTRSVTSVAVLGGGTMGLGIAAASADAGADVLLLDVTREAAEASLERMKSIRPPAFENPASAEKISLGSFEDDLEKIANYDWICEAIIEDLETKRSLFEKLEPLRKEGSVVSTNTSGIPLKDIAAGMPERLRQDIVVTHFFNPVKIMRLMELIPGEDTTADVTDALADFCANKLGKGVVYAKDTVNFIGNRIGCFFMLSGLHKAQAALKAGMPMEKVDALLSKPVGLPPTGLYGLIDLIGLDIMDLVGKNLQVNLPAEDVGRSFTSFPGAEQAMLERGQLGRKAKGGFYRLNVAEDGTKTKEIFDLTDQAWRAADKIELSPAHAATETVFFGDDAESKLVWDIMGGTLLYAADLVPEIADDVVNIDRAMRWGFGWAKGPFELLDQLGPKKVIAKLEAEGQSLPAMLAVLKKAGSESFYRKDGQEYLSLDGQWVAVPAE
ncbi:3-hydroxyacyl-CoA dehydrogenase NAD-binding domain-containing protein [Sneathiella sp.]|jgi:3-hydroxyacyl-CoA dehydrogenase|uniref:3-hydroxyacyl-CoA dehydrogenase n=1 Tax=Sneathiella sp. TaxID=1964365 RepID=UPI0039E52C81